MNPGRHISPQPLLGAAKRWRRGESLKSNRIPAGASVSTDTTSAIPAVREVNGKRPIGLKQGVNL